MIQNCCFPKESSPASESFKQYAIQWLLNLSPELKESTKNKYENLLVSYVLPYYGDCDIESITHDYIESVCRSLLVSGGLKKTGLSPKTVADSLSIVRSVLRYCQNKGIAISCDGTTVSIKQKHRPMRVLSRSEQVVLNQYLFKNDSLSNIGIFMALYTGLRIGELCALKWSDISLDEHTITVSRTLQRIQDKHKNGTRITVSAPKSTCSIRTIPMPESLYEILKDIKGENDHFVLTGKKSQYIEPRSMQNHFHKILRDAGIKDANFHALRHTFATRCVEADFDPKSLSEILGHSSISITMNRYVHPSIELKRKNMDKLSSLIKSV